MRRWFFDLVEGNERNVAKRIDAHAGEGCGRMLLECELLLSTGPEGAEIDENCRQIVRRYAENQQMAAETSVR